MYSHENPARWKAGLSLLLPPTSKIEDIKHHEAMTMEEARKVAKHFIKSENITDKAILFGMLTASRANEFQLAEWSEIDFETRTWSHMRRKDKKSFPHRVPLSDQAVELLKSIKPSGKYVFTNDLGNYLDLDSFRRRLQKMVNRKVTMHGCRSTFSMWCAENGADEVLREKSLMHKTENEVAQAYQRSDLLEQRRPLMQAWADALTFDLD